MTAWNTNHILAINCDIHREEDSWCRHLPALFVLSPCVSTTGLRACLRSSTEGFDLVRSKRYRVSTASLIVIYRIIVRYCYVYRRTILPQTGARRLLRQALKWHMENIHGQAHESSESNVPTVGSDAPDEQHAPASDHCFPAYRSRMVAKARSPQVPLYVLH